MKIIVATIALAIGLFLASASAEDEKNGKDKDYNDRPFICGAVFRILMEGHANDKDREIYNKYKVIFDDLYEKAKTNIISAGGNENDAKVEMQDNIDFVGKFAKKQKDKIDDLLLYCERIRSN